MDPASRIDTELARLHERLARVERRLEQLDGVGATDGDSEPFEISTRSPDAGTTEWLPMAGRTLVVVGGAFVLRAVTEGNLLAPAVGSALAIVYAVIWWAMADRAAARGRSTSAFWHTIAATIVAFPLVWEATVQFGVLSPVTAGITLGGITAIGLFVAWHRSLLASAMLVTIAAVATSIPLAVATKQPVMFAAWLLAIGLAGLWIGYSRGWTGLAWLGALPAVALTALVTLVALVADAPKAAELLQPRSVIALQLALVVLYIGSFALRALVARAEVRSFEIAQGLAVIVVGLGGALGVARKLPGAWVPLGVVAAVLAAADYAVSFTVIDRTERRTNFIYYSSLAMVFTLVAAAALLPASALSVVLAIGAVMMAWAGAWTQRATLSLHGAVYVVGAAAASGLLGMAVQAWPLPLSLPSAPIGATLLVTLVAAIAYCAFEVPAHGRTWGQWTTIPKFVVLTIALAGVAGVLLAGISHLLPGDEGAPDPAALASVRTGVLAGAAVFLAWLGRYRRMLQATWLVYPLLLAGGVKLLAEDLRVAGPGVLVASFALYGGALILAPRWVRSSKRWSEDRNDGDENETHVS